jgi:hypothetical protein
MYKHFTGQVLSSRVTNSLSLVRLTVTNVILPAILIFWLAYGVHHSQLDWLFLSLGVTAYVIYDYITGMWLYFGYYLRYVLLAILALAIFGTLISVVNLPLLLHISIKGRIGALFFAIFSPMVVGSIRGFRHPDEAIEVSFPFRDGSYHVAHGGSSVLINHHMPASTSGFAVDIVKLNSLGFRADGFHPKSLNKYHIFGESVYSPVEGKVVKSVNGLPDMLPLDEDRNHPYGNHVIIKLSATNVYLFLVHLQQNSLLVSEGDTVSIGQPIGKVGNSGVSSEPHLHIHATLNGLGESDPEGKRVALIFNGRFLRRNSVVRC